MKVSGKIEIGGRETEFLLTDEGSFTQWGPVDRSVLGERVGLLEKLGEAYLIWREENLCRTCSENLLDDGEGYDGECGDCADRNPANRDDDGEDKETVMIQMGQFTDMHYDDEEDGDGPEEG